MTDDGKLEAIAARIRALADAALETGKPYLLSKLGNDLRDDLRSLKESGNTLAGFIQARMADAYTIVRAGTYGNVQALVAAADTQETAAAISTGDDLISSQKDSKTPRYHYRFWAAFSVPLTTQRRYLDMHTFTFTDGEEPVGTDFKIIDPSYIAPKEIIDRNSAINKNICSWLEQNDLPAERFHHRPPANESRTHSSLSRTVLDAVIQSLDKRQLASTTLTLDVVAELLRRRL